MFVMNKETEIKLFFITQYYYFVLTGNIKIVGFTVCIYFQNNFGKQAADAVFFANMVSNRIMAKQCSI